MECTLGLVEGSHVYRSGNMMVVPVGAALPPFCVKCGEPATNDNKSTSFSWHSPWLYVLIFFGLIFYAIVAMVVQKKARIIVPLCEEHQKLRRRLLWVGTILLVGSVPAAILIEQILPQIGGWSVLLMVLFVVAGLIVISPARQFLRPTFIDGTRAEFTGGAEAFLQHLPLNP